MEYRTPQKLNIENLFSLTLSPRLIHYPIVISNANFNSVNGLNVVLSVSGIKQP